MALEGVIQVLDILSEAAKMVPIAGDSLEGVCTVLSKICTIAQDVKDTKEEFMDLADYAAKTVVKVAGALQKADTSKREVYRDGMKDIYNILDDIVVQAERVNALPFYRRILGASTKTRKELDSLRRRLTIACTQFGVVSQLQIRISVDELKTEVDRMCETLAETKAAERRAFCHQKLRPVHAEAHSAYVDATVDYCHPDTRTGLMDEIAAWACSASSEAPVYWISGFAGTGKSTVARTLCKRLASEPVVLANFFFSGQSAERTDPIRVPGSLSYQLALANPSILSSVSDVLHHTPDIVSRSIFEQVKALLATPLQHASPLSRPIIIVLDALDECGKGNKDSEGADLVPMLVQAILQPELLQSVKLLVTSREIIGIVRVFDAISEKYGENILCRLDSTGFSADVEHDIRCYIQSRLNSIAIKHGIHKTGWPSSEDVDKLCRRSGKLFIFASTIVRFLDSDFEDPRSLLQHVLNSKSTGYDSPYKHLDELYTRVLDRAVNSESDPDHRLCYRFRVLIAPILNIYDPRNMKCLSACTGLSEDEIKLACQHLRPVLRMNGKYSCLYFFHASFREFLTERCRDNRFTIIRDHKVLVACQCLRFVVQAMATEEGKAQLPYTMAGMTIDTDNPVHYAAYRWLDHLSEIKTVSSSTSDQLRSILEDYLVQLRGVVLNTPREDFLNKGPVCLRAMPDYQVFLHNKLVYEVLAMEEACVLYDWSINACRRR